MTFPVVRLQEGEWWKFPVRGIKSGQHVGQPKFFHNPIFKSWQELSAVAIK